MTKAGCGTKKSLVITSRMAHLLGVRKSGGRGCAKERRGVQVRRSSSSVRRTSSLWNWLREGGGGVGHLRHAFITTGVVNRAVSICHGYMEHRTVTIFVTWPQRGFCGRWRSLALVHCQCRTQDGTGSRTLAPSIDAPHTVVGQTAAGRNGTYLEYSVCPVKTGCDKVFLLLIIIIIIIHISGAKSFIYLLLINSIWKYKYISKHMNK